MKRETKLQRFAWWLRMKADRISPDTGPRALGGYRFTIEGDRTISEGPNFRSDGRGCQLWYMAEDHDRAHDEADTEHIVVLWENLKTGDGPKTRRAGGQRTFTLPRQAMNDAENLMIALLRDPAALHRIDPAGYWERELPAARQAISDAIAASDKEHGL